MEAFALEGRIWVGVCYSSYKVHGLENEQELLASAQSCCRNWWTHQLVVDAYKTSLLSRLMDLIYMKCIQNIT